MPETQKRDGFLNRWSSRKQQANTPPVETTTKHPDTGPDETSELAVEASTPDGASDDTPVLTDTDMPAIETLTATSDVSGFFSEGVSAALRKAALRHVFQQPAFNVRDGLNDYDGDYTVFEPLGDTITSDMKWHTARKERLRLEAEEEARKLVQEQESLAQETQQQANIAEEKGEDCESDELQDELQDERQDERQDELQGERQDGCESSDEELTDTCSHNESDVQQMSDATTAESIQVAADEHDDTSASNGQALPPPSRTTS